MAAGKGCDDMDSMASNCSSSDREEKTENILGASDYAPVECEASAVVLATGQLRVPVQCTESGNQFQPADEEKSLTDDCVLAVSTSSPVVSSGESVEGVLTPSPVSCLGASGLNVGAPTADERSLKAEATLMQVPQTCTTRPTENIVQSVFQGIALKIQTQQLNNSRGRGCQGPNYCDEEVPGVIDKNGYVVLREARRFRENQVRQTVCVACWERAREVTLIPCGHNCLCYRCFIDHDFALRDPKRCPLCREVVDACHLAYDLVDRLLRSQMP